MSKGKSGRGGEVRVLPDSHAVKARRTLAPPRRRVDWTDCRRERCVPGRPGRPGKRSGRPEAAASWGGNVQEQGDWMQLPWTAKPHAERNIAMLQKGSIDKLSQGPREPIRKGGRPKAATSWGGNVQEQEGWMRLPWTAKPHAGRNIAMLPRGSIDKSTQRRIACRRPSIRSPAGPVGDVGGWLRGGAGQASPHPAPRPGQPYPSARVSTKLEKSSTARRQPGATA